MCSVFAKQSDNLALGFLKNLLRGSSAFHGCSSGEVVRFVVAAGIRATSSFRCPALAPTEQATQLLGVIWRQMASSSAVSPQFKLVGCRSEFSVDCSQKYQRKTCPTKSLSLSRSWQDSGRLLWSGKCKNRQLCKGRAGLPVRAVLGRETPDDENDPEDDSTSSNDSNNVNSDIFREKMQRMIDSDDAAFGGKDLATLIRKKYGRSYDVQFIKKEFMGRQLLAMNVMWKYREQRSFPLTEEEYLLHLDWIASTLKNWGAVSYVRSALAGTKEKPRIGKAVSIFIDLDEFGGRAKEWIKR